MKQIKNCDQMEISSTELEIVFSALDETRAGLNMIIEEIIHTGDKNLENIKRH